MKNLLIEIFMRGIPESAILIYGVYVFSRSKMDIKKYLQATIILCAMGPIYERLPLHYGAHTAMGIVTIIIICIVICKIDLIKVVQATMIVSVLEISSEIISLLITQYVFKVEISTTFRDMFLKHLYGLPSLIIMLIIIMLVRNRIMILTKNNLENK